MNNKIKVLPNGDFEVVNFSKKEKPTSTIKWDKKRVQNIAKDLFNIKLSEVEAQNILEEVAEQYETNRFRQFYIALCKYFSKYHE